MSPALVLALVAPVVVAGVLVGRRVRAGDQAQLDRLASAQAPIPGQLVDRPWAFDGWGRP